MVSVAADVRVGNLMTLDPVVIDPNQPVAEAERLMKMHRISGLPVVDSGTSVGVISQTDILVARSSQLISGNWERLRVRHIMTTPAVAVHVETSIHRAAALMVGGHIHRLVVVDADGRAIGVVSALDLLRLLLSDPEVQVSR